MTLSAAEADQRWVLEPNPTFFPPELTAVLSDLGLNLRGETGLWEFDRANHTTRDDMVIVNGVDLREAMPLLCGKKDQVGFRSRRESFVFRPTASTA
jgi:hypothetical protein